MKRRFQIRLEDNKINFILNYYFILFIDVQIRIDRNNNDLTVFLQILNEVFSKSNPYHLCLRCWSIESRDSIKYHSSSFSKKKKNIFPSEKERQHGETLVSKLKTMALTNNKINGDWVTCFVLIKKGIICLTQTSASSISFLAQLLIFPQ